MSKIVRSLIVILVVFCSMPTFMVSQPIMYALYKKGAISFVPPPFTVYSNFSSPVTVTKGESVILSARIKSHVNKTINIILTLGGYSEMFKFVTWESQYVEVPPYESVYNDITITVSEDAPLGGFPRACLTGEGYGSVTCGQFGLRVIEDNDWKLIT